MINLNENTFMSFPRLYYRKTWGTALPELRLLGNETQMLCGSNWLWEQPIAALICNKQNHVSNIQNNFIKTTFTTLAT